MGCSEEGQLLAGFSGNDTLLGGAGWDTLIGGDGNDFFQGGLARDVIVGGPGIDFVSYEGVDNMVYVDLRGFEFDKRQEDALGGIEGVVGGPWPDDLTGSGGANTLFGADGDDLLAGAGGPDTIDGGAGRDTARFMGALGDYAVAPTAGGWIVSGPDGDVDTLTSVERLWMTDCYIALEFPEPVMAVRILGAAFGADAAANLGYRGVAIQLFEGGRLALEVCDVAAYLLGGFDNAGFVGWVYANLTGTAPSPGEHAAFTGLLDSGAYSRASLLLAAAQTEWCAELVDVEGLELTGVAYVPPF